MGAFESMTVEGRRRAVAARAGLALLERENVTLAQLFREALAIEPSIVNHRAEFFEVALWALGEAVAS